MLSLARRLNAGETNAVEEYNTLPKCTCLWSVPVCRRTIENLSGHGSNGASLPELSGIKPIYFLPTDPMADEVLIPSFAVSDRVDNMAGFFSKQGLGFIGPWVGQLH